jgi:hypothetical protein
MLLAIASWVVASPAAAQDFDGNAVADASDPNDDNDALNDVIDPFALDRNNGLATAPSVSYEWQDPATDGAGGLFGLGFTGLMTDGKTDYLSRFAAGEVTTAGGAVTVNPVGPGDAYARFNTQRHGFQFGVRARPTGAPFTVHTRIVAPFQGIAPTDFQSMGLFVGTGDQDNYVKVTTAHIGRPGIQVLNEQDGAVVSLGIAPTALPGPELVDLYLRVDPAAAAVQPSFSTTTNGTTTPRADIGPPISVPAAWFTAPDRGLAVGILSTAYPNAPAFAATWDLLEVTAGGGAATGSPSVELIPIEPGRAARVSSLRLASRRFPTTVRRGRRVGTTVLLSLTGPARVDLEVYRRTSGRRAGSRCVKPTRANRRNRTCIREVRFRGSVRASLGFGSHRIRFTGRIAGRRLPAGQYRLVAVATDPSGERTRTRGPLFRVTR